MSRRRREGCLSSVCWLLAIEAAPVAGRSPTDRARVPPVGGVAARRRRPAAQPVPRPDKRRAVGPVVIPLRRRGRAGRRRRNVSLRQRGARALARPGREALAPVFGPAITWSSALRQARASAIGPGLGVCSAATMPSRWSTMPVHRSAAAGPPGRGNEAAGVPGWPAATLADGGVAGRAGIQQRAAEGRWVCLAQTGGQRRLSR
jgi:hypothetical protein